VRFFSPLLSFLFTFSFFLYIEYGLGQIHPISSFLSNFAIFPALSSNKQQHFLAKSVGMPWSW